MDLRYIGLPLAPFRPLFLLSDSALRALGMRRLRAGPDSGLPCRVSLRDAAAGEKVLLLSYVHVAAPSPYHASGPIFVREAAEGTYDAAGPAPAQLYRRLLSLRAYDKENEMVNAEVVEGDQLASLAVSLLDDPATAYLHVHYARRGCYAARIERA